MFLTVSEVYCMDLYVFGVLYEYKLVCLFLSKMPLYVFVYFLVYVLDEADRSVTLTTPCTLLRIQLFFFMTNTYEHSSPCL